MKSKIAILLLCLFLISIVSAQLGYNNPKLPRINSASTTTITTSSSGGNVTSVTSSTNCILVSPTTGDVILTFNTSCSPGSTFNYNQTTAVFTSSLLNQTIAMYGTLIGFNSTFNSTYALFAYNQSGGFAYNQTRVNNISSGDAYLIVNPNIGNVIVLLNSTVVNNTISNLGLLIGFNSTFNSTYALWAYNQTFNNNTGSVNRSSCWKDDCGGFRAQVNQAVNTTSDPAFNNLTVKNISSSEWIFGKNLLLSIVGTAIFPDTTFNVGTVSVGGGLVSLAIIKFTGGAGLTVGAIQDGLYIIPASATTSPRILLSRNQDATDVVVFETQNTTGDLNLIRQNPFAGGTNAGRLNATNWNITSNHQITNNLYNFDTTYTNNVDRPIIVHFSFQAETSAQGDQAYVQGYVQGVLVSKEGAQDCQDCGITGGTNIYLHNMEIQVPAGQKYSFNSTVGGSGVVKTPISQVIVI